MGDHMYSTEQFDVCMGFRARDVVAEKLRTFLDTDQPESERRKAMQRAFQWERSPHGFHAWYCYGYGCTEDEQKVLATLPDDQVTFLREFLEHCEGKRGRVPLAEEDYDLLMDIKESAQALLRGVEGSRGFAPIRRGIGARWDLLTEDAQSAIIARFCEATAHPRGIFEGEMDDAKAGTWIISRALNFLAYTDRHFSVSVEQP